MWLSLLFIFPLLLFASENRKEVLALSSAIVDHLVEVKDDEIPSAKGSWSAISFKTLLSLTKKFDGRFQTVPGGSGVNVLKTLARFDYPCRVIGRIGDDPMGDEYSKALENRGVTVEMTKGLLPTGRAICMISPDGQRTFKTYLGSSHATEPKITLDEASFDAAHHLHIEGYQLIDKVLLEDTLTLAKKKGLTISLDLANYKIVQSNKDYLLKMIPEYVNILFCNEIESYTLTGLDPEMACAKLTEMCATTIVTMSERGCYVSGKEKPHFVPAFSVPTVDSTGAGDNFAAGFLSAYFH